MKIRFEVPGEPKGKGRPRFSKAGGFTRTYTPKATSSYENLVRIEYQSQCGGVFFDKGTMLDVRIVAYMQIPSSASKKKVQQMRSGAIRPTKKPDFDNLGKIVCDAINGVAYHDDSQIVDAQIRKFYSDRPRIAVTIQDITNEGENSHE